MFSLFVCYFLASVLIAEGHATPFEVALATQAGSSIFIGLTSWLLNLVFGFFIFKQAPSYIPGIIGIFWTFNLASAAPTWQHFSSSDPQQWHLIIPSITGLSLSAALTLAQYYRAPIPSADKIDPSDKNLMEYMEWLMRSEGLKEAAKLPLGNPLTKEYLTRIMNLETNHLVNNEVPAGEARRNAERTFKTAAASMIVLMDQWDILDKAKLEVDRLSTFLDPNGALSLSELPDFSSYKGEFHTNPAVARSLLRWIHSFVKSIEDTGHGLDPTKSAATNWSAIQKSISASAASSTPGPVYDVPNDLADLIQLLQNAYPDAMTDNEWRITIRAFVPTIHAAPAYHSGTKRDNPSFPEFSGQLNDFRNWRQRVIQFITANEDRYVSPAAAVSTLGVACKGLAGDYFLNIGGRVSTFLREASTEHSAVYNSVVNVLDHLGTNYYRQEEDGAYALRQIRERSWRQSTWTTFSISFPAMMIRAGFDLTEGNQKTVDSSIARELRMLMGSGMRNRMSAQYSMFGKRQEEQWTYEEIWNWLSGNWSQERTPGTQGQSTGRRPSGKSNQPAQRQLEYTGDWSEEHARGAFGGINNKIPISSLPPAERKQICMEKEIKCNHCGSMDGDYHIALDCPHPRGAATARTPPPRPTSTLPPRLPRRTGDISAPPATNGRLPPHPDQPPREGYQWTYVSAGDEAVWRQVPRTSSSSLSGSPSASPSPSAPVASRTRGQKRQRVGAINEDSDESDFE